MNILYHNQLSAFQLPPCVATLGFFDGVHLGHQSLISHVVSEARRLSMPSVVVTFDQHPRQVLATGYQPEMLTTLDGKLRLLQGTGVDTVVVLRFDKHLAALTAREFMARLLRDRINVRRLIIGYDNKFGRNRAEGFADYVVYGQELGMEVIHGHAFQLKGVNVSSSVVRAFLREGEVRMASQCLGRCYSLPGRVVDGHKEGRKLGFPTANMAVSDASLLIPANGAYAVRVRLADGRELTGMTNVGNRPTFDDDNRSIETYIFCFHEDIYGQQMELEFVERIREERRFDSITQLANQLKEDKRQVENIFRKQHETE